MQILSTLNGHVLVKPRQTSLAPSGIAIPASVDKEREEIGEVVLAADLPIPAGMETGHCTSLMFRLAPGATVLFHALSPRKIVHAGEDCLLIHADDILAVIEI